MWAVLKQHWPEYLMEAWGLGLFMVNACLAGVILEYPASSVHQAIPDMFARRALFGIVMGLTIIVVVYSPWGKRSGAHINPAFTLTFLRLGKIAPADAAFYILAQFAGGLAGVLLAGWILPIPMRHPKVNYEVTIPGPSGLWVAFGAEAAISLGLMLTVLVVSNMPKLAPRLGLIMGVLVALYITFEGPLSGMSMNPARTVGSALPAHVGTALWLYFTAPPLAMLLAAELYRRLREPKACAKMHHGDGGRCLFCEYQASRAGH